MIKPAIPSDEARRLQTLREMRLWRDLLKSASIGDMFLAKQLFRPRSLW